MTLEVNFRRGLASAEVQAQTGSLEAKEEATAKMQAQTRSLEAKEEAIASTTGGNSRE